MSYYVIDGDADKTYSRPAAVAILEISGANLRLVEGMRDGQILMIAGRTIERRAGHPTPTEEEPDDEQLEAWVYDSVCDATDGCSVEPDGTCEHGHPSWLIVKGLM